MLELHKLYEALDMRRCLEIFEGYRVGPWDHHIFRHYWYRLTMVDHMVGYFYAGLRGLQGLNQGYPLMPNIFNVVMDEVVRNWVSLVLVNAEEPYGMMR